MRGELLTAAPLGVGSAVSAARGTVLHGPARFAGLEGDERAVGSAVDANIVATRGTLHGRAIFGWDGTLRGLLWPKVVLLVHS